MTRNIEQAKGTPPCVHELAATEQSEVLFSVKGEDVAQVMDEIQVEADIYDTVYEFVCAVVRHDNVDFEWYETLNVAIDNAIQEARK